MLDKHYTTASLWCQVNSWFFLNIFNHEGQEDKKIGGPPVAGVKKCEKSRKKADITTDFADLHGFWGEIWPARGGWGEKMRKNVRKKAKN